MAKYEISDGEKAAAEFPKTFIIPPLEERAGLKVGQFAKIRVEAQGLGERFWVQITRITSTEPVIYEAEVANKPVGDCGLVYGSKITIEPKHVLGWLDA